MYEVLRSTHDKTYNIILENITSEILKLKAYKAKREMSFKNNLFASPDVCNLIFLKVDSANKELEEAKIELEKRRDLYSE